MIRFLYKLIFWERDGNWYAHPRGGDLLMRRWRAGRWDYRPATEREAAEYFSSEAW